MLGVVTASSSSVALPLTLTATTSPRRDHHTMANLPQQGSGGAAASTEQQNGTAATAASQHTGGGNSSTVSTPKAKRARKDKSVAVGSRGNSTAVTVTVPATAAVPGSPQMNGGGCHTPPVGQQVTYPSGVTTPLSSAPATAANTAPGAGGMKQCGACGHPIQDRFLLYAMDTYWHQACLRCQCCHAFLADIGQSCYQKQGMILCKEDYVRLFGSSGLCARCGECIPATDLVMRTGVGQPAGSSAGAVYHVRCFRCEQCACQLRPGDRYTVLPVPAGTSRHHTAQTHQLLCEVDTVNVLRQQYQQLSAVQQQQQQQQLPPLTLPLPSQQQTKQQDPTTPTTPTPTAGKTSNKVC